MFNVTILHQGECVLRSNLGKCLLVDVVVIQQFSQISSQIRTASQSLVSLVQTRHDSLIKCARTSCSKLSFKKVNATVCYSRPCSICKRLSNQYGSRWRSCAASDSESRGPVFDPHKQHRVVSLSKAHELPTVLVKPRKRWHRRDMTEKLLTGTLSLNTKLKQSSS